MSGALARRLSGMKDHGGVNSREIAQLLDTTPETVSRWSTGKVEPRPNHLERLLVLEWLLGELSEFYDPDEARLWLFSPHKLLQGETPAARIKEDKVDEVLALIEQLRTGAYV